MGKEVIDYDFPEYVTELGTVTFDYDDSGTFTIAFSQSNVDGEHSFTEGSISIKVPESEYEHHKKKMLKDVLTSVQTNHKNGVAFQLFLISQLRFDFVNVEVDPILEQIPES